jgi:hypothetical protein
MKKLLPAVLIALSFAASGCKKTASSYSSTDLSVLAAEVPATGPREGNNYKVFLKVLRGTPSTPPAAGFKVEAWVKGKGEPKTITTDKNGIAIFSDLPFPDPKQNLNIAFHYYKGKVDQTRSISYPYLDTDAYRMKDTQYIPENVTPDPQ